MLDRCHSPNSASYADYGARGIRVCDRWRESFAAFLEDLGGEIPRGLSLDRIDPTGNYEPGNVRLATAIQQARNKRTTWRLTWQGRTLTIPEWSEITGIKAPTLKKRIEHGWTPEETLTVPAHLGANQTLRH